MQTNAMHDTRKGEIRTMSTPHDEPERTLPEVITIPNIKGEMCELRPATWADCERMDDIHAFDDAEVITGKSSRAERAAVRSWVSRSIVWTGGGTSAGAMPDYSDPESRGVMAWSMYAPERPSSAAPQGSDDAGGHAEEPASHLIGMIFLVDIDGWGKSARLQVVLGIDYRGRGYSRDAMPRVMTYGFAPEPVGLGLERIWLSLPDANTRNSSVYESLGFDLTGRSRNAMWDGRDGTYHDLLIFDEIAEEYDPIRSLAAFGLHNIIDNPGVKEALAARERTMEIAQRTADGADGTVDGADGTNAAAGAGSDDAVAGGAGSDDAGRASGADRANRGSSQAPGAADAATSAASSAAGQDADLPGGTPDEETSSSMHTEWAYGDDASRQPEKRAWWRNLGRNRNRKGDA